MSGVRTPAHVRRGDHRSEIVSPVEAVLELGEVARHMFTADGAIGANNGGFDIAQSRARECRVLG
jgi:hypothetical protein